MTNIIDNVKNALGYPDVAVIEVAKLWNSMSDIYSQSTTNSRRHRDMFLGNQWTSEDLNKKDRVHRVYNYGAQLLRKFQMYEGAKGFDLNVKYTNDDALSLLIAEATEALAYQILDSAKFFSKYLESRLAKSLYGTIYYGPLWNPDNKDGGPKGTLEIRTLTSERCRVLYQDNNFEVPEAFITCKRMNVEVAQRIYGNLVSKPIVADEYIASDEYHRAVKDYVFGSQPGGSFNLDSKNMVTIWNMTNTERYVVTVGDQVAIDREHNYKINGKGFCPIVPEHNIYLTGYHIGFSDLYFVEDQLRALNKLYSLLEEIVEDNAYPIMFEINNSLRGQKLKRGEMRGKVFPMTVGPNEEGIRQLQASTLVQPVLAAISEVKSTIFDISSMPAAAFGAYQPNTKSGFQATIQMQPALQEIDGRQVRTAEALNTLIRQCLAILEVEDSESLTISLPAETNPIDGQVIIPEQEVKLSNLSAHTIEILFGNPLPKDDARVIQNETMKYSNKLQSKRTTMQNLGVESPSKETNIIDQEDIKVAEIQAKVQTILAEAQAAVLAKQQAAAPSNPADLGSAGPLKPGQAPEQKMATPPGEEELAVETAGEAVADTSTL